MPIGRVSDSLMYLLAIHGWMTVDGNRYQNALFELSDNLVDALVVVTGWNFHLVGVSRIQ